MTQFMQVLSALREQMQATLSRSDVLKPLAWLIGLLLLTLVLLIATGKAPDWLITTMAVLNAGAVVAYLAAYAFCLFADRDALRSERYTLHKMAIEHGLYGDSKVGLFEPGDLADQGTTGTPSKQIESKQ